MMNGVNWIMISVNPTDKTKKVNQLKLRQITRPMFTLVLRKGAIYKF